MPDPILSTLQQALASGSRSTVLKPLGWLIGLTLVGTVSTHRFGVQDWLTNTLGCLCIASIVLYMVTYVYFAFTDKDALRSEKYSIQKLAIQKGFIGDDQAGYIPIINVAQNVLPAIDQAKGAEDGA